MNFFKRLMAVPIRCPKYSAIDPAIKPTSIRLNRYFTGTLPINISSIQVENNSTEVEKLVRAIKPHITPHQIRIGIRDSLISEIFCCLLASILAKLEIKANFAKSDG